MAACSFPVIKCSGDAYSVGFTHGQQAKDKIGNSAASYRVLFKEWAKLEWPEVMRLAAAFCQRLGETHAPFLEELRGIADGAAQDLHTIVALNCRSEIALTVPMDGCSSIASKGANGERFVAQNWDWVPTQAQSLIVLDIAAYETRPAMKFVTEAGIIGKIGLNEHGIATIFNAIKAKSFDASLIPAHFFLRLVLEQKSLSDCRAMLARLKGTAAACHVLIGTPQGSIGVECSPKGFHIIEEDGNGMVLHTNHLLSQELAEKTVDLKPWADSEPRLRLLEQLCTQDKKQASHKSLRDILSDTSLGAGGLVRHQSAEKGPLAADTLFNITTNCSLKRAEVKEGLTNGSGGIMVLSFEH